MNLNNLNKKNITIYAVAGIAVISSIAFISKTIKTNKKKKADFETSKEELSKIIDELNVLSEKISEISDNQDYIKLENQKNLLKGTFHLSPI